MTKVHYRCADVEGQRLFHREAGDPQAPALVLLHGFPTSSFMFRELIPALSDRYRVIAPDLLGFGLSDASGVAEFDYTFDALAALTSGLLKSIDVTSYAMYVQDYGAPIGWRLASGTHAYVANFDGGSGAGSVTAFRIGARTLTPLVAATPTGSAGSEGLALAEDGKSLYVANLNKDGDGSVASYRVGDDGTLGPLRGPVPTGGRQPDLTSITVAQQAP